MSLKVQPIKKDLSFEKKYKNDMKLVVKLFATLRAKYPQVTDLNPLEVEVEKGITVEQLVEQLGLPKEQVQLIYIDGMRSDLSTTITKEGATIALFPALGGG